MRNPRAGPHRGPQVKSTPVKAHPAADLFPLLDGPDLAGLVHDIRTHGQIEPIVVHQGKILDGRNRFRACEQLGIKPRIVSWKGKGDPILWVLSANLHRRHLSASQKAAIAVHAMERHRASAKQRQRAGASATNKKLGRGAVETGSEKMREASGKASERAAEMLGCSSRYVEMAMSIADKAPDLLDRVRAGDVTLSEARVELRARDRKAHLRRAARGARLSERAELFVGDAENVANGLEPASFDAILCDPPYSGKHLDTYAKLGRLALRLLKPGAPCLAMAGQAHLPDVMDAMRAGGLTYHWTLAYLTMQLPTRVNGRRVSACWKPVLLFARGRYVGPWISDVVKADRTERTSHHWEQGVDGMSALLERVAKPGSRILDPFCGSGTSGMAALRYGCHFVGIDIDRKAITSARRRLLTADPGRDGGRR